MTEPRGADAAPDALRQPPSPDTSPARAQAVDPLEHERMPLRELDRSLAPIRRMVAYALAHGGAAHVRFLGVNLAPHLARALELRLPDAMSEPLAEVALELTGLDPLGPEERRGRLSQAFALLNRIDALAGLPLRLTFRPVPKARQVDLPEEPVRAVAQDGAPASPDVGPAVARPSAPEASSSRRVQASGPEPGRVAPPPRGSSRATTGVGGAFPLAGSPSDGELPLPVTPAPPVTLGEAEGLDDEEDEEEGPSEFAGDLSQPVAELAGCPPELALALLAAGIETVRDLVWCRPSRVEVFETIVGAGRELPAPGERPDAPVRAAVGGRLAGTWTVLSPDRSSARWSRLVGAGPLQVRWAVVPDTTAGRKVVVAGTVSRVGERVVLVDAECAQADGHVVRLAGWGIPDVEDRALRALWGALAGALDQVRDPVSAEALRRVEEPTAKAGKREAFAPGVVAPALSAIPAVVGVAAASSSAPVPASGLSPLGAAIAQAQILGAPSGRRRLAFDEALIVQIAGILPRLLPGRDRAVSHAILHEHVAKLGQTLDIVLGDSAQAALEDIKRDLRRHSPMRRLLVSEVGAGKGRIALLAAVTAAEAKSQVLVVGADATDAENRLLHAEPALREVGLVGRLLGPSVGAAQRDALRRGEVHVAFCTPELLEAEPLEFRRLGLVIAFERETFGRAAVWHANLATASRPHLLIVPSVPVGPRILTTAYADLHVSLVRDEQRRPARISLCRATERVQAYQRIRDAVDRGDQGVVVFPMVDGRDAVEIPEALRVVRALEQDALRGLRVTLLHGAMPREEQARVHEDFSHRRIQVLVSTTRIEDAPTAPGASIVVIEQADRVEQWRLHRIIGYFSRSQRPAEALLVVGEAAELDAAARIDRVVSAPDGFQLTESLVRIRGTERCVVPGSAPAPSWRWFEPDRDLDLLLAAREEAHQVLRQDPVLRRGGHAELAHLLRARWELFWPDGAERGWTCLLREDLTAEPRRKRRRRRRRR